MNTIHQELSQGTPLFKVNEDGTEEITIRPPTSKELRAAALIKQLFVENQICQAWIKNLIETLQSNNIGVPAHPVYVDEPQFTEINDDQKYD